MLDINNIEFIDWVTLDELSIERRKADICLGGHFGETNKAKRVIPGKVYDCLSARKPVILGNNPANRELFEDGKNVIFVEHGNPEQLADAILNLKNDEVIREKIAEQGYKLFLEKCTPFHVVNGLIENLKLLIPEEQK
jgi:glycosyltransferase involved in cell wall biosynthesis